MKYSILILMLIFIGCAKRPKIDLVEFEAPPVVSDPEPEVEPTPDPVVKMSPAVKWFPPVLYFDFDSYILKSSEIEKLENLELRDNCVIEGYTCPIGEEEYNMALSERRAVTVSDWLKASGRDQTWDIIAYGEDRLKTEDRATYHLNRRVVIRCE